MDSKVPGWMIAAIAVQAVLAGLLFLYGYSETKTLALGRAPALRDIIAMALPLAAVAIFGAAAWIQWRAGRRSIAKILVWAPIPLSVLLFALSGMI
jgi:hypothetical protein